MKKKKLIIIGTVVLLILFFIIIFMISGGLKKDFRKEDYAQIYLYDLGKSQVSFIKKDDHVIMINTGLEQERDKLCDYLEKLDITKIDYLILTNRNDEYIGNVSYMLNNYLVDYIYFNDFEYTSKKVEELENVLDDNYTNGVKLTFNESITFSDLKVNIYPDSEENAKMEDKTFIVEIVDGDNKVYVTTNASTSRMKMADDSNLIISENADLYRFKADYYLYDGNEKIAKNKNLLKRDIEIFMNEKEFIID